MFTRTKTQINSDQFIIASVTPYGKFSVSPNPKLHGSYQDALAESRRLALSNRGYKFVVLALAAVAQVAPSVDPVNVTYRL